MKVEKIIITKYKAHDQLFDDPEAAKAYLKTIKEEQKSALLFQEIGDFFKKRNFDKVADIESDCNYLSVSVIFPDLPTARENRGDAWIDTRYCISMTAENDLFIEMPGEDIDTVAMADPKMLEKTFNMVLEHYLSWINGIKEIINKVDEGLKHVHACDSVPPM